MHPTCGSCSKRKEICKWPLNTKIKGEEKSLDQGNNLLIRDEELKHNGLTAKLISSESSFSAALLSEEVSNHETEAKSQNSIDFNDEFNFDFSGAVVDEIQGFKEDLAMFQMELDGQRPEGLRPENLLDYSNLQEVIGQRSASLDTELSSIADLDTEGLVFFECYRTTYCNFVSIGLQLLNYFNKTFIWLGSRCAGVAYALTAWGGFYLELSKPKSDFTRPWSYMQRAAKSMYEEMGPDLKPQTKDQLLNIFGFYLIFIGIEVCTGDVRNWRGLMKQCKDIIASYGGPILLSRAFNDSNDIKWLLYNFCFHDILSSHTLTVGTTFPVSEYEAVVSPDPSYGIDPLHGIVAPVYMIFGHIGNHKARLARQWDEVAHQISIDAPDAEFLREQYYEQVLKVSEEIEEKINNCKPNQTHLDLLKDSPMDYDIHVRLFELYLYACRSQFATSIQKLPLCAIIQQRILLKSLRLLDSLLLTQVRVALSLLILICGLLCCTKRDRTRMTSLFRMHSHQYQIGNLQRVEETVLEAWEMSPDGAECLDWADLVRDKNWHLYVG